MTVYAALGSGSALAAEATWILDGTGAFTNAQNWSTATVPGAADSAVFAIGGVAQISAADDITIDFLTASEGGLSFSGGSLTTASNASDVRVGSSGGTGSLTMNQGALTVNSSLRFGDSGVASLNVTDATISQQNGYMVFGGGGGGSVTATFSGDSQLSHLGNWFLFGDGIGTSAEVTFKDGTEVTTNDWTFFGKGGAANVTFEGDSVFTNSAGATIVGEGNPSDAAATLTLKDNVVFQHQGSSMFPVGHNGGKGSLIMSGNSEVSVAGEVYIGNDSGAELSNGLLDMSGDSTFTTVGTKFVISRYNGSGTVNVRENATLDVATSIVVGENGTGVLNISGTATVKSGSGQNIYIGSSPFSNNERMVGDGTVNLNGGELMASDGSVIFGVSNANNAGTNNIGTLNLNGGTVTANGMSKGVGTGTVNFNGSTVKAGADSADYFSGFAAGDLHVLSGGFKIDTNGFTVSVSQGLSGVGELRKLGEGILNLLGENTLTGTANVIDGTLTVDGSLAGTPLLNVAAGASLELANPNAIALNDNIVLNLVTGSQLILSFSGIETVGALVINGTYLAPGEYSLAELQAEAAGMFSGNSNAIVNVTAVPEPGTFALLGLGTAFLVLRHRSARRN